VERRRLASSEGCDLEAGRWQWAPPPELKAGARGLNLPPSLSLSELRSQVAERASSVVVDRECFHVLESCGIREPTFRIVICCKLSGFRPNLGEQTWQGLLFS
jgi:hypothetical protein